LQIIDDFESIVAPCTGAWIEMLHLHSAKYLFIFFPSCAVVVPYLVSTITPLKTCVNPFFASFLDLFFQIHATIGIPTTTAVK